MGLDHGLVDGDGEVSESAAAMPFDRADFAIVNDQEVCDAGPAGLLAHCTLGSNPSPVPSRDRI